MSNQEVIKKYYETVNTGNWEAWLALFDENVVVDEQIAGRAEGVGVLAGAANDIKRGYKKFLMHPIEYVYDGEKVAVLWHCEAESADGKPIDAKGANFFKINNGKITYMTNFHDTAPFKPYADYIASHPA